MESQYLDYLRTNAIFFSGQKMRPKKTHIYIFNFRNSLNVAYERGTDYLEGRILSILTLESIVDPMCDYGVHVDFS